MGPPPRPPIICYDLHTETNSRQASICQQGKRLTTNSRRITRPRITVIRKEPNELDIARSKPLRYRDEELAGHRPTCTAIHRESQHGSHRSLERYQRNLVDLQLSRFRPGVFDGPTTINELEKRDKLERQNARLAYSTRLKDETDMRERQLRSRREKQAHLQELDAVSHQLETIRRVQENLRETYGLSHRAARYFQKQDEENTKLKRKMEKFSEVRSRELGNRIRQMKRIQALNKQQSDIQQQEMDENSPLSSEKHFACKSTSPLKNSVSPDSAQHSGEDPSSHSSSSTISISSFSSMSSDDLMAINHLVRPTAKTTCPAPILSSSFSKKSLQENNPLQLTTPKSDKRLSFFKRKPSAYNETLEITDLNFFDKIEDRTMFEVNQLMNNLHTQLRE